MTLDIAERFRSHVETDASGCHLWTGHRNAKGYGSFRVGSMQLAHRVAWQLANGPIPEGLVVCHRCDVRACVNPAHLFLGTQADNVADMLDKGRRRKPPGAFGSANPWSKLTESSVLSIKRLVGTLSHREIAQRYGVARETVSSIARGKSWGWLNDRSPADVHHGLPGGGR